MYPSSSIQPPRISGTVPYGRSVLTADIALSVLIFLGKLAFLLFVYIWVRWTLPRFRYDQLMGIGWKVLIPLALVNLALTALGGIFDWNWLIPLPG